MASPSSRIQVCGRIVIEADGVRREHLLPGQQGRTLFAFLVVHRAEQVTRDVLVDALWGQKPPVASEAALHALLSKLRRVLPCRSEQGAVHLELPVGSWVDLEAARDAIHRAESATAQRDWARAWAAAQTAMFTARRGFLAGNESAWVQGVRAELQLLYLRALETYAGDLRWRPTLETYAAASLGVGHTELATAERASRELVSVAPYRESGHRLLMSALAEQGNAAEALHVYETLRVLLRDELGVMPSAPTRLLHAQLLGAKDIETQR